MILKRVMAATGVLALSACSSSAFVEDANALRANGASPNLDLTPFIGVIDELATGTGGIPNDTYVRLNVREVTGPSDGRLARRYESRGLLARYLFGTGYGVHLNAKISITPDPKIDATVPLVSLTHDSNSDAGEVWYTALIDSDQPVPYFRVRSNAKLSATFEFKRSNDVSSAAIKTAMTVVREAANAIAPGASLVTHLSKDAVKQRAGIYDTALGKLFSTSITEQRTAAAPSQAWDAGKGYKVSLRMPGNESSLEPQFEVGTWEITIANPVVSAYIPEPITATQTRAQAEAAVVKAVKPNEILGYKVGDQTSVYGYLAAQDWFTSAVATIAADGDSADDTAGQLCQKVVGSLDGLLLNDLDSRLGLWAVVQGMSMPSAVSAKMQANGKCQGFIGPIVSARS